MKPIYKSVIDENPAWKNKGFNSVIEYRGWLVFNSLVSSESSLDNCYYNDFNSEHLNSKENTNKE